MTYHAHNGIGGAEAQIFPSQQTSHSVTNICGLTALYLRSILSSLEKNAKSF